MEREKEEKEGRKIGRKEDRKEGRKGREGREGRKEGRKGRKGRKEDKVAGFNFRRCSTKKKTLTQNKYKAVNLTEKFSRNTRR